jgi:hypothetical protein
MLNLELKIPPPVILICCAALAWVAAEFVATPFDIHGIAATMCAIASIASAIALIAYAILAFRRVDTTINPTHSHNTLSLVTSGVFRLSRNPMYLAQLLLLLGWVTQSGQHCRNRCCRVIRCIHQSISDLPGRTGIGGNVRGALCGLLWRSQALELMPSLHQFNLRRTRRLRQWGRHQQSLRRRDPSS